MASWELMPILCALSQFTDSLAVTTVDKPTNMLAGLDSNGEWEVSHWIKQSTSLLLLFLFFLIVVMVETVCVVLTFHAQRLQSPQGKAEVPMVVLVSI